MNPLLKKSACELADLLRSGEITSVELTQACLDRIDAIDPKVHAFLYVDREGALATAADVDARRAAGEELPREPPPFRRSADRGQGQHGDPRRSYHLRFEDP